MADTKKQRPARLGRGLSSMFTVPVAVTPPAGAPPAEPPAAPEAAAGATAASPASVGGEAAAEGLWYVQLDAIVPNPHQPRQRFDEAGLRSLAESIRADGLMQPVVLRLVEGGAAGPRYELVAGERRWRAARLAGLEQIPALVRELDDQQLAELALIENLQREDLNPIDRAEAFQRLGDRFHLTQEAIAARVGLDRSTVANLVRLLQLAPSVQQLVRDDLLSMGHARALLGVEDAVQQEVLAKRAIREGLSVREVEAAARKLANGGAGAPVAKAPASRPHHFEDLERQIGQQLGTKVALRAGRKKGAGRLTIEFYSLDQFDSLLEKLGVTTE